MGKTHSDTELQKSLDFCAPSLLEEPMKVQSGAIQQDGEVAEMPVSMA